MAASALNTFVAACLLALVVAAGAARTVPDAETTDPDTLTTRACHSNNAWSGHLCKDVCLASGFSRYDFTLANTVVGSLSTCCCCPKGYKGACLSVK